MRAVIYIVAGLSAGAPFFYLQLFAFGDDKEYYLPEFSLFPWALGGAIYIGGATLYALRIPEKYYPYKFDHCGASHNIFHVCVMVAFTVMFMESLRYYYASQDFVCPIQIPDSK